jgi:hypothetical protein
MVSTTTCIPGTSNPIEGGNTFTVECWSKAPRSQPNGYPDAAIVTLAAAGAASDALGFWCDAASPPTSGSGRSNLVAWLVAGERIESDTRSMGRRYMGTLRRNQ